MAISTNEVLIDTDSVAGNLGRKDMRTREMEGVVGRLQECDGLAHILERSAVGATVDMPAVPRSSELGRLLSGQQVIPAERALPGLPGQQAQGARPLVPPAQHRAVDLQQIGGPVHGEPAQRLGVEVAAGRYRHLVERGQAADLEVA